MRHVLLLASIALAALTTFATAAQDPLRVFIRSGPKTHGPGAHDYPRFLREWVALLNDRGARATGADAFPTKAQLDQTDVLVLHAAEAGNIPDPSDRKNLTEFLARGGGLVVIHAGAVSRDPDWYKQVIGGSWRFGTTKWLEGPMHLYFTNRTSPITKDVSNWAMDDEIYYDMEILPEARILAAAYTPKAAGARNAAFRRRAETLTGGGRHVSIYDVQPQMWTYERTIEGGRTPYRAFVSIPGHLYENFDRPNYRAVLLRGLAWAGRRENVDELLQPDELGDNLRYVDGGPTHPAKAAAKLEVHPEFDVTLVAAEPLITKAMNLDWDGRGRLWVSETPEYPNGRRVTNTEPWRDTGSLYPRRQARDPEDTISILSDSDGDGLMDRKHVFADKLELVTGFVLYKDGVIAATAPDIWYLADTNGDEVADTRTKLYTGLGTFDTHAVINNLRWGLDGWVYATHGYSTGIVTSADGTKDFGRIGSGVVRFRPDGSAFEQFSSRGGNTWGLDITWDGQVFWTQPTSGTVFFHTLLPEHVLAKGRLPGTTSWKGMITGQDAYPLLQPTEQAYVQIDQVGQFTAAAGCAIYDGGAWPERWRYSYFTTEPTLNIVHHQFVEPEGVSYTTRKEPGREQTEFIRSRDLWFRPIEARVGPDGALYIIDFYNQAVIHNDTRGPEHGPANAAIRPDRDHYFGRIWRVQHKQAKRVEIPSLDRRDLPGLIRAIETSPNAHVRQTAWRLVREHHASDPRAAALRRPMGSKALQAYEQARAETAGQRADVLAAFAKATDNWTRSALVAAASDSAPAYVSAALGYPQPEAIADFVAAVVPAALPEHAARLLVAAADAPAAAAALKSVVIRAVARMEGGTIVLDPAVTQALQTLLDDPATGAATLPIVAKWDKAGALAARAESRARVLLRELDTAGTAAERRADLAESLLPLPQFRADVLSIVASMLVEPDAPDALIGRLATLLADTPGRDVDEVMVTALARTSAPQLFDVIVKRPASALALLAAMKDGRITAAALGPGRVARLRAHPDRQVAQQAAALLNARSSGAREKSDIIAALVPEVQKAGNPEKGRTLFVGACGSCHKLDGVGESEIGPPLNGMGAHGPAALLTHIIDPNREVDPSYWQWNVTTRTGETLAGVVARENAAGITLRTIAGDVELKKEDIVKRENTHLSLMPEGLEGLGAEALRDILAFMAGGDQKFRVLDLRDAYTADSRRGFGRDEGGESAGSATLAKPPLTLHRFGDVAVGGVPFFVMDPARSPNGLNLIALRGGTGRAGADRDLPQRVEIQTSASAASLHFLGGVGAGAWPTGGEAARGKPVMKVQVHFADGTVEEHVLKNGEHFADYDSHADVPLSTVAGDFTYRGQLRYFALNLRKPGVLSRIVLEGVDADVVPCTVAVTAGAEPAAEQGAPAPSQDSGHGPKEGGPGDAPLPPTTPVVWAPGKTKVLIVGGGSAHDFAPLFGEIDGATLTAAGFTVHYTEDRDQAAAEIANADVAVISVNRMFFDTPAWRKALVDFAAAGKGIVMLHPGTWYAYPEWPELNASIVGGGARGHDRLGRFSVTVVKPEHSIMKGVPPSFEVDDELYYVNAEPEKMPPGTAPIEVLAQTSPSLKFKRPHPSVWVTQHPTARVVAIALGHDRRVHEHEAFRTLLANAVKWAGRSTGS